MWADGGGKARGAATRPLVGPTAVGQFVLASLRFVEDNFDAEFAEINGQQALILRSSDHVILVLSIEVHEGKISTIRVIGNPDKLKRV